MFDGAIMIRPTCCPEELSLCPPPTTEKLHRPRWLPSISYDSIPLSLADEVDQYKVIVAWMVSRMFLLSKILSAFTQPLFWLSLWWFAGLVMITRWFRAALFMLWSGLLALGILGFQIIPDALLRSLENRYAIPSEQTIDRFEGIIVLGGATGHPDIFKIHAQVPLGDAAERMTVPVGLMRKHPKLELVFSGGEGLLLATGFTEAQLAAAFFEEQGLEASRVKLESRSRNTRENAQYVANLLGDRCKQPWLLVTSAWHMPRAAAEFTAVKCNITPFPVDFKTARTTSIIQYSLVESLGRWQMALHEWLGLCVYAITRP